MVSGHPLLLLWFSICYLLLAAGVSPAVIHSGSPAPSRDGTPYIAYGDSITACCYPTSQERLYPRLIAADLGLKLANRAQSGDMGCDVTRKQMLPNPDDFPRQLQGPIYSILVGTNDAFLKGPGPYQQLYSLCLQAAIAWAGVPTSRRVSATSSQARREGQWAQDEEPTIPSVRTAKLNSKVVFKIRTDGGSVFLWYRIYDSGGGNFQAQIDDHGAIASVDTTATPKIASQNGVRDSVALLRITDVAPGDHILTVSIVDASDSRPVSLIAAGTAALRGPSPHPIVLVGGVPFERDNLNEKATQAYDAEVRKSVALLREDRLDVRFVDVRSYLKGNSLDMQDGLHPNDTGHRRLRDAFEAALSAESQ